MAIFHSYVSLSQRVPLSQPWDMITVVPFASAQFAKWPSKRLNPPPNSGRRSPNSGGFRQNLRQIFLSVKRWLFFRVGHPRNSSEIVPENRCLSSGCFFARPLTWTRQVGPIWSSRSPQSSPQGATQLETETGRDFLTPLSVMISWKSLISWE